MSDPTEDIAAFICASELPIEQTIAEINDRWPEVTQGQLDQAARLATEWFRADTAVVAEQTTALDADRATLLELAAKLEALNAEPWPENSPEEIGHHVRMVCEEGKAAWARLEGKPAAQNAILAWLCNMLACAKGAVAALTEGKQDDALYLEAMQNDALEEWAALRSAGRRMN